MMTRLKRKKTVPRLALMLALATTASCASTKDAQDVYDGYVSACQKGNETKAAEYLADSSVPEPCPDAETAKALPTNAELFMHADVGYGQLTSEQNKWRVLIPAEFEPDTPFMFYYSLKTALKNRDHARLAKLLRPQDARDWPEKDIKAWLDSAQANDLYAALCATPAPWFELDSTTATCEAGGRHLTFELIAGKYYVAKAVLTERQ